MSQTLMTARHERWARLVLVGLAAATALLLAPVPARAHAPSNATLSLVADGTTIQQRWDIALRDLDRVLPLDADDDGQITWGELREAWPQISALADDGLRLGQPASGSAVSASCQPGPLASPRIDDHADGTYAVLDRRWQCPDDAAASGLRVDYRLFADSDASHRGLLQWRAGAQASAIAAVLAPTGVPFALAGTASHLTAEPSGSSETETTHAIPSSFAGFVAEGVHHILIGTDHVLFLLALMLPAVVLGAHRRASTADMGQQGSFASSHASQAASGSATTGPGSWAEALLQVAKVVTAFTVAHSITLAIAVLGYADPPSRIVESLIAASVVLAAIDNLKRFLPGVRWQLAFVFGLVHGFGFAGALKELGLDSAALARSLVGFNLGVELGQLGIVAIALPLAWWVRDTRFYRRVVLGGGSAAIAAVAALWFAERAFDLVLIG
jgi:hypothetical protein